MTPDGAATSGADFHDEIRSLSTRNPHHLISPALSGSCWDEIRQFGD